MTMYGPVLLPPMMLFSIIQDPANFMRELAECKWARASLQFISCLRKGMYPINLIPPMYFPDRPM